MQGAGWAADGDRQARFFKKGMLQANSDIHRGLVPAPNARVLEPPYSPGEALVHFNYVDLKDFIDRLNRYTTAELGRLLDYRPSKLRSLRRAWRAFGNRYFRENGKSEGWQGFYLSLMMAFYSVVVDAKAWERAENGSPEDVRRNYDAVVNSILDGYPTSTAVEAVLEP